MTTAHTPNILFDGSGRPYAVHSIKEYIDNFKHGYNQAVTDITEWSSTLDQDGKIFIQCAAKILTNFKMTRRGPFEGVTLLKNGNVGGAELLEKCWSNIGKDMLEIKKQISQSRTSRGRFLLGLTPKELDELSEIIWLNNKKLLPYTMGKTTYGLVGASKILFSVLPEVVLPVDNVQWVKVFKTVDLGDVIRQMTSDIKRWENDTGKELDRVDPKKRLTTLPAVYNVMAMHARPV